MKRRIGYLFSASGAILLLACVTSKADDDSIGGPSGRPIVKTSTDSSQGLVTALHRHGEQVAVASPAAKAGSLKGVAGHHAFLLGLLQWGTDGVGAAARHGSITEVNTVAHGGASVLWGILYYGHTTMVTGENGGETPMQPDYKSSVSYKKTSANSKTQRTDGSNYAQSHTSSKKAIASTAQSKPPRQHEPDASPSKTWRDKSGTEYLVAK